MLAKREKERKEKRKGEKKRSRYQSFHFTRRFLCFVRLFGNKPREYSALPFSSIYLPSFEGERKRNLPSPRRATVGNQTKEGTSRSSQSLSKTFRGKLLNAIGIFLGGPLVVLVVLLLLCADWLLCSHRLPRSWPRHGWPFPLLSASVL